MSARASSFWHSNRQQKYPVKESWQDPDNHVLPPIDQIAPTRSFNDTFVRGNNFGKPSRMNVGIQATPRERKAPAEKVEKNQDKHRHFHEAIIDLRDEIRMKDEEIKYLEESMASYQEQLAQESQRTLELEAVAEKASTLEEDIMTKEAIIMEQNMKITELQREFTEKLSETQKKCDEKVAAVRNERTESLVIKEEKLNQMRDQISGIIGENAGGRSDQIHQLRDALRENEHENYELKKELKKYKESCPNCKLLRESIKENDRQIAHLEEELKQRNSDVGDLKTQMRLQNEMKFQEIEQLREFNDKKLKDKEYTIERMKQELSSSWNANAQERSKQLRDLDRMVSNTQDENQKLAKNNEKYKRQIGDLEREVEKLRNDFNYLKEQKVQLADMLVVNQQQLTHMRDEYEGELDFLYQKMDEMEAQNMEERSGDEERSTAGRHSKRSRASKISRGRYTATEGSRASRTFTGKSERRSDNRDHTASSINSII